MVEKLDFVDDILGQRLAVPLLLKFSISFNNVGGHLLDLCNTATQANTKNVRGNNTTRLFRTLVDLSLHGASRGIVLSVDRMFGFPCRRGGGGVVMETAPSVAV